MKKTIIWLLMFLVLTSLAFAAKEDLINEVNLVYPNLISGEAIQNLTESETATLVKHVKEKPTVILAQEKAIEIKSLSGWLEELKKTPPGGYEKKLSGIDTHFSKYIEQFKLTPTEVEELNKLTAKEKAYVVATLGRSRDRGALIVYWMIRHPQFNYILFHEDFHTYTTDKVGLLGQITLEEASLPQADEKKKTELQKKIDFQKQKALFIILWNKYVGTEKEVFFSNYGQANLLESLSEFFARAYTGYFAKDLAGFETAKDKEQIDRYISAFAISNCFGLFESLDGKKGLEVKNEILKVINNSAGKKAVYDDVKAKILKETTCPPAAAVPVTYSGKMKQCQYSVENNQMSTSGCKTVEVSELQVTPTAEQESVYLGYDANGKLVDFGYVDKGKFSVTNYLSSWPVESTAEFIPYTADELAQRPMAAEFYTAPEVTRVRIYTPPELDSLFKPGGAAAGSAAAELGELPATSQCVSIPKEESDQNIRDHQKELSRLAGEILKGINVAENTEKYKETVLGQI